MHVRHRYFPVLLDETVYMVRVPPILNFLEKAQVGNDSGSRSTHARSTVHIYNLFFDTDQLIENFHGIKQLNL